MKSAYLRHHRGKVAKTFFGRLNLQCCGLGDHVKLITSRGCLVISGAFSPLVPWLESLRESSFWIIFRPAGSDSLNGSVGGDNSC